MDLYEFLKEKNKKAPKFGSIEIIFKDGKPYDIIITDRVRI